MLAVLILTVLVFVILAAIVSVESGDLLYAVIALAAVGVGTAMLYFLLQAPDLAITQLVIDILTLIIFVGAISKTTREDVRVGQLKPYHVLGCASLGVFLIISLLVADHLPPFGGPLSEVSKHYLDNALQDTRALNVVSAIVLDYRGYDTLGEITVLFAATISIVVVLRPSGGRMSG